MGYPMAVNLRSKIGKEKTIVVSDVDMSVCERFKSDMSEHGPVSIVKNAYEAVRVAVRPFSLQNRGTPFLEFRMLTCSS